MHPRIPRAAIGILLSLLAACATVPPAADRDAATDDLAEVAADALAAADMFGKDRVLVVLDIDNTLLAMEQGLGSDQWYEWQKNLADHDPCNPQYVGDRFAVQGAVFFASAMRPTQPDGPQRIRELQDAGLPVIVVTSRGVGYRLQTFRELRRNGFSFAASALGPGGVPEGDFTPPSGTRPVRYEDGVFLTTGQAKGAMLRNLLTHTGQPLPALIVVADDKQGNLDAVTTTFRPLGVAVHAWRYTREDATVAAFDPAAADRLWQDLKPALQELQAALGPDNYDLATAVPPPECTAARGASGP